MLSRLNGSLVETDVDKARKKCQKGEAGRTVTYPSSQESKYSKWIINVGTSVLLSTFVKDL